MSERVIPVPKLELSRVMPRLRWVLLLMALLYVVGAVYAGWRETWAALSAIGLPIVLLALLLTTLNWACRAARWQGLLWHLHQRVPLGYSVRVYVGAWVLTFVPGKLGELLRSVYLLPYGVSLPQSMGLFFVDRFSDLLAMLLLMSLGLAQHREWLEEIALFWGVMLLVLASIHWHDLWRGLARLNQRHVRGRWQRGAEQLLAIAPVLKQCTTPLPLALCVATGMVAYSLEALALYAMVSVFPSAELTLSTVVFIYAASKIFGAASLTPGGVGATELAIATLLVFYGLPEAEALACALLSRLTGIWYAVLVALWVLPEGPASISQH